MNNTEKLLRAFIEASGFDIERNVDISYGQTFKAGSWGSRAATSIEFKFFPATDEMPEAEYREVIRTTNYKVTKKKVKGSERFCFSMMDIYSNSRYKL